MQGGFYQFWYTDNLHYSCQTIHMHQLCFQVMVFVGPDSFHIFGGFMIAYTLLEIPSRIFICDPFWIDI